MSGRSLLLVLAVALAGCGSSSELEESDADLTPVVGSWRGTMVQVGVGTLPTSLVVTETDGGLGLTLVAGAIRVTTNDASLRRGRFQFRASDFPVSRTSKRTIRCDLDPNVGIRELRGRCLAGSASYTLTLRRSGS